MQKYIEGRNLPCWRGVQAMLVDPWIAQVGQRSRITYCKIWGDPKDSVIETFLPTDKILRPRESKMPFTSSQS